MFWLLTVANAVLPDVAAARSVVVAVVPNDAAVVTFVVFALSNDDGVVVVDANADVVTFVFVFVAVAAVVNVVAVGFVTLFYHDQKKGDGENLKIPASQSVAKPFFDQKLECLKTFKRFQPSLTLAKNVQETPLEVYNSLY